jgi:hypothetical protein
MVKKKVDFPFIKVYDLKGLNATQKLFVCRIWSFQSKKMKCYITNDTWADYLGVSPTLVKKIKSELREIGIINPYNIKVKHVYLLKSIEELIKFQNENYQPKYSKEQEDYNLEVDLIDEKSQKEYVNFNTYLDKIEDVEDHIELGVVGNDLAKAQIGHQLNNISDDKLNNLKNKSLDQLITPNNVNETTWSIEFFQHEMITSIDQTDIDLLNSVQKRNIILSYWYNCFSTIELFSSINLFLDEDYFNIFTKILRSIPLGKLNINYLIGVDINCFFDFIKVYHTSEQEFLPKGSMVPLRQVVSLIISEINDQKVGFKTFLNPNQK